MFDLRDAFRYARPESMCIEESYSMEITINIPDTLTENLQHEDHASRDTLYRLILEELVAELYRTGKITKMHAMQWLGLEEREEFYTFLYAHKIPLTTLQDLQHDRATTQRLGL